MFRSLIWFMLLTEKYIFSCFSVRHTVAHSYIRNLEVPLLHLPLDMLPEESAWTKPGLTWLIQN